MAIEKILLIHTAPSPGMIGTDAVYNETKLLLQKYPGSQLSIFPFSRPNSIFPRYLYGVKQIRMLRSAQKGLTLNHIFSPSLYFFPVLRVLTKPIVYTVTASIRRRDVENGASRLKQLRRIVVSSRRDLDFLLERGFENVSLVLPGMNLSAFRPEKLAFQEKFTLLMASAPWEVSQFESKGVHRLFQMLRDKPNVELVLLWRGILKDELSARIMKYGVQHQVKVVYEYVDIKSILASVHAAVLIVNSSDVVKSYPHSLIESLAGGKPVLVSRDIAMSDYVEERGCGVVVENFADVELAIEKMIENYVRISKRAREVGGADFLAERMLKDISKIYEEINTEV